MARATLSGEAAACRPAAAVCCVFMRGSWQPPTRLQIESLHAVISIDKMETITQSLPVSYQRPATELSQTSYLMGQSNSEIE